MCVSESDSHQCVFVCALFHHCSVCSVRYNSEGRVTNVTLPTGEVSGFHGNLERWSRVEVEAANRENFVTSTNLSASDTIYTFKQGDPPKAGPSLFAAAWKLRKGSECETV